MYIQSEFRKLRPWHSKFTKNGNHTLVKVDSDRMDTNNAPELKSKLVVVNNEGEKNIILDLSSCNYCDSSGLRSVLVANRLCEDAIGTFILCGLAARCGKSGKNFDASYSILLITKTVDEAKDLLEKKESL